MEMAAASIAVWGTHFSNSGRHTPTTWELLFPELLAGFLSQFILCISMILLNKTGFSLYGAVVDRHNKSIMLNTMLLFPPQLLHAVPSQRGHEIC